MCEHVACYVCRYQPYCETFNMFLLHRDNTYAVSLIHSKRKPENRIRSRCHKRLEFNGCLAVLIARDSKINIVQNLTKEVKQLTNLK